MSDISLYAHAVCAVHKLYAVDGYIKIYLMIGAESAELDLVYLASFLYTIIYVANSKVW